MKVSLNSPLGRVTLRQLRALHAVAEHRTVTGAAGALGLTPPAVSLALRELETLLDAPLIERSPAGARPTEAGEEVLAAYSRVALALADCADGLAALRGGGAGRVSVGVISTAKYFAPRALAAFRRAHPNVELKVLVGNRRDTIEALEGFSLDFALMGRPPEHFAVDQAVIGPHPHVIIAAPDHPLTGRRLRLAELGGEVFLLREQGSGTRILVQRLFAEAGMDPHVGMELGSNETIKQAVMAGMGIALLSAHTIAAEVEDRRLAVLDVEGLPVVREWYVVKRREKRLLPAARALWDELARDGHRLLPRLPGVAADATTNRRTA
jgi:DNA-binding transcriptional LysR family regulator